MNKTIYIEGMHCQHCVQAVEQVLQSLEGISEVKVDLEHNLALVCSDTASNAEIKEAIEDIGFDVTAIE